jgi:hypothetical protein
LLGISVSRNENLLPEYIINRGRSKMDNIAKLYSLDGNDNFFSNPVPNAMATRDKNELSQLNNSWYLAIKQHPLEYLNHRVNHFLCMLRIGRLEPGFIVNVGIDPNEYGFFYKKNILSGMLERIMGKVHFIFMPWVYLVAMIPATYIVFKSPKYKSFGLCLAFSAFSFMLPHFFILPSFDYRYLYYFYICTVLQIIVALTVLFNHTKTSNE